MILCSTSMASPISVLSTPTLVDSTFGEFTVLYLLLRATGIGGREGGGGLRGAFLLVPAPGLFVFSWLFLFFGWPQQVWPSCGQVRTVVQSHDSCPWLPRASVPLRRTFGRMTPVSFSRLCQTSCVPNTAQLWSSGETSSSGMTSRCKGNGEQKCLARLASRTCRDGS